MADMRETPTGQFNPDVRYTDDPELDALLHRPIGKWGTLWHDFIMTTYPSEKVLYVMNCTWQIIPRQVDEKADKRYDELAEVFENNNPRPVTPDFNILLQWETERKLWIEHIIMEEIVCVKYPYSLHDDE